MYPTEDEEKVLKALGNLFDLDLFEKVGEERLGDVKRIEFECRGPQARLSLGRLYERLREQEILDAARRVLREGVTAEGSILFHLNKQAAFANAVSFSEGGESPLGPIVVEIFPKDPDDVDKVIDWLAPETIDGKPIYEVRKPRVPKREEGGEPG
ncbi:MAG: RNA-binding domain-containing protein [Methanopyraceae archaeon]